jgi:hypothetical protein
MANCRQEFDGELLKCNQVSIRILKVQRNPDESLFFVE